jgi:hypothetical protein
MPAKTCENPAEKGSPDRKSISSSRRRAVSRDAVEVALCKTMGEDLPAFFWGLRRQRQTPFCVFLILLAI